MAEETIIRIKCPNCDKEFGVSLNAFDHVKTVIIECYDGTRLDVSLDKPDKSLTIKQIP